MLRLQKEIGDVERMLKGLESKTLEFEALRGALDSCKTDDVARALSLSEGIADDLSRILSHSYMKYTVDTADQKAKASLDKAEELDADIRNRSLFFRLWWTGLPDSRASGMVPRNRDYAYVLASWRKLKPYTLQEKVEQAVNIKNTTGFFGWSHHYDKVTSDFMFTLRVRGKTLKDGKGKPKELVTDEVARLFTSPDPDLREAAYKALLAKYAENGGVLGEVYRTIVRDWRNENVKLRGYRSPIAPRNLENDLPDEVVDTLLRVCSKNATVFQGFFRAKAKLLGMKKMSRYHIYAPLSRKERHVTYAGAVKSVMEAFRAFNPRVADLALRVFETGHADSSPRKGKRSGAYCMSVTPSVVPYLFLNFAGVMNDVYTVAHESGHAVHSQLSSSHSVLTFQPPLVLAETASVFGEMMLFDKTMRDETDVEVKRSVLLNKISSMYGTIGRQAHFVMFENSAHEAVNSGATVEDLCKAYLANLKGQFGSAVHVPEEFKWEWTYIPHIYHTPFYCYAYAFGNLLSLALYERYTKEGRSFVPKFLKILSYGGSERPEKILAEVGFDLRSERFWQSGFDVVSRMVTQLQKL
jgi:oligoendopeptidase F